jgi:type II secretory pathway pseudopilin PulG
MRFNSIRNAVNCEMGIGLLETVIVLAVLGTVAVSFLAGMIISSRATFISDEKATAESLARSQMEWAQSAAYTSNATQYAAAPIPEGKDYTDYSANITAQSLHNPDDDLQKITVTISHSGSTVFTLENYKGYR